MSKTTVAAILCLAANIIMHLLVLLTLTSMPELYTLTARIIVNVLSVGLAVAGVVLLLIHREA